MVVLLVGIPGVAAETLPRANDNLELVAVDTLAEALAFIEARSCEALMIGTNASDMDRERLSLIAPSLTAGSASTDPTSYGATNERDIERVFRRGSIREMERLMILDRLKRLNQNRTRSAESLEISVRTLRNKLRDYRTRIESALEAIETR
ncbi:MAG TPA: helix-turn-helix domain-containing protein [Candidatus Krumholzibacteria bacterium]|nr:helix-turn-helix domain-containing protein [Candidatus Krumholzibacteria bacterium]